MKPNTARAMTTAVACLLIVASSLIGQEMVKTVVVPAKPAAPRTAEAIMKEAEAPITKKFSAKGADVNIRVAPADGPRPAVGLAARNVANLEVLTQQRTGMIRPILRAEYQFLVAVAAPTKDQRKAIATAGERALKVVAAQVAEWDLGRRPNNALTSPDPLTILREALAEAAKSHLDREATTRYRNQFAARLVGQKRAVLLNLVARLDLYLYLSASQREAISTSLSANWQEGWSRSINTFAIESPVVFAIPDGVILPHLTEAQKGVWSGLTKIQSTSYASGLTSRGMDNVPLEEAEINPIAPAKP